MAHLSRVCGITLYLLLLLALTITCAAQTTPVVVNVAIQDEKGIVVTGLLADNFQVVVDKAPQKIVSFQPNAGPASIGIIIDDSGSMFAGGKGAKLRSKLTEAFAQFSKLSDQSNEYFTMLFNSKSIRVQDWSNDPSSIVTALTNTTGEGNTPLFDSLSQALSTVTRGSRQKHVLILISDGQDSMSKTSFNKLRDELRNSDVLLYAVAAISGADAVSSLGMEGQAVLDELTTMTGGRAYYPRQNRDNYSEAVLAIAADLQSQYQLGFVPEPPSKKNDWRRIKLRVLLPTQANNIKKLVVRSRQAFR
jgi:Ca-activated chloride channel family protein